PISLPNPQPLQGRRPAVAPLKKLSISQPQIIINNRLAVRIETSCPSSELQRSQRDFHVCLPRVCSSSIAPKLYRLKEDRTIETVNHGYRLNKGRIPGAYGPEWIQTGKIPGRHCPENQRRAA